MKQRHMGVILPSMPHDGHHQTIATPLRFGWSITAKLGRQTIAPNRLVSADSSARE
jgi:hypothetical protein